MNRFYHKDVESSTEYVLPDYLGDVKKVLSVSASAIPSGRFAGDDNVELSGIVVYDVLYADTDGMLSKLSLTSDYDFSAPVVSEEYMDSTATPRVISSAVRFTGPRKLVARATVENSVVVLAEDVRSGMGDAFEEGRSPEVDTKYISEERLIFTSSQEREYAEEAERFSGLSGDDIEIIATSGTVKIYESIASENGVTVKGEMVITSIIRTEDQPPFAISKTIPFEENVTLEGARPDMQTLANAYLTSVASGVSEDEEGAVITVNAIAEFACFAAENKESSVICDAYLKDRDTEVKYENVSHTELVCMGNSDAEFLVSASRSDIGCEGIREIISLTCELGRVEMTASAHGAVLSGDAVIFGTATEFGEEGQLKYTPFKLTSPFSVNVNLGCQIPNDTVFDYKVDAYSVKPVIDAEMLSVKCDISVAYHAYVEPCVRKVSECNVVGECEYTSSPSTVTIYYPERGESLFDIAKKFHTSREKIASDNKLDSSVAFGFSDQTPDRILIR